MKNLISLLSFLVVFSACSQQENSGAQDQVNQNDPNGIQWMGFEDAVEEAAKTQKDIFVMVHANWCPKCAQFGEITFNDPEVIEELNTYFLPVFFNAHGTESVNFKGRVFGNPTHDASLPPDEMNSYHELLYEIGAKSIPSIVFMDHKGNVTGSEMGYKPPGEFRAFLRLYSEKF